MTARSLSANDRPSPSGTRRGGARTATIAGVIKQAFRGAVKAITRRGDDDEPTPRRRRSGETGKDFRQTAPALLRRAVRLSVEAIAAAYLFDFHDWMLQHGDNMDETDELDGRFDIEQSHFSPRL